MTPINFVTKNANHFRPNHFIELSKVLGSSSVHDIYIQNYPVHCFSISNSAGLDIYHITLNNSAGYAPNARSNGLAAAHNSDGASNAISTPYFD
jgi:polygalacturonase